MGEAKRRKLAGTYPDTSKPRVKELSISYPGRWLTDQFGYEPVGIALAQNIMFGNVPNNQGDCMQRGYHAWRLLKDLGIDVQWVYGSMVAKVGTGQLDSIVFGTEDQYVMQTDDGWLGHTWLRGADGSLADFTVGRWPEITAEHVPGLPPIQWRMQIPDHWWVIPEKTGFIRAVDKSAPRAHPEFAEVIYREFGDASEYFADELPALEEEYQQAAPTLMRVIRELQSRWRGRHSRPDVVSMSNTSEVQHASTS